MKNKRLQILYQPEEETVKFAADELSRYLMEIGGETVLKHAWNDEPAGKNGADFTVYLGLAAEAEKKCGTVLPAEKIRYDGFVLQPVEGGLVIAANISRGVSYGVYEVLEMLGCRFYNPEIEKIPHHPVDLSGIGYKLSSPEYEYRLFDDGGNENHIVKTTEEIIRGIRWMYRNKCNGFFLHRCPAGNVRFVDELNKLISERGMVLEFGGHGVNDFADRKYFEEKPEMFRMDAEGKRSKSGNFCSSSAEALEMVYGRVREICEKLSNVDVLHLWFEDSMGGSWCNCEKCRGKSSAKQLSDSINYVARRLQEDGIRTKVDMLLYHDTLNAQGLEDRPEPNILGYYAPRERCYAHAIDDASCPYNQRYYRDLELACDYFGKNIYFFEYYSDVILFNKMKIDVPDTLMKDLAAYRKKGISRASTLFFGKTSWVICDINMMTFCKGTWNLDFDCRAYAVEYYEYAYGMTKAQAEAFYESRLAVSKQSIDFSGYKYMSFGDIRGIPYIRECAAFMKDHLERLVSARKSNEEQIALLENPEETVSFEQKKNRTVLCACLEISDMVLEITGHYMGAFYGRGEHLLDKQGYIDEMNKAVEIQKYCREYIDSLPVDMFGESEKLLYNHLCADNMNYYIRLASEADLLYAEDEKTE